MTEAEFNELTFKTIFDVSPNAMLVMDYEGKINHANHAAQKLFAYSIPEITGQPVELLFPKPFNDNSSAFNTTFIEGAPPVCELTATRKDGTDITVEMHQTHFDSAEGEITLLTFTDITEAAKRDAIVKKQLTELKVAGNYLEQLAYISAHDLKNPIITLDDLTAELLNSKDIKGDDLQILQMQKKVITQMRKTNKGINDILKLRQGLLSRETADNGLMPLGGILANVTDTLRADVENTNATLTINLNGLNEVQFPYFYLQSAFYNLITNAIKYRSPQRNPIITFEAKRLDIQTFHFTINDNGLGFDMESNKNNLFGIFKRFHPKIDGTGLGLHIVKSIVDAYNGEITVNSAVDKGTTFDITLKNPILA